MSIDQHKSSRGPNVDGLVGYVSHAYVNQLVDQMGQLSIHS